MDKELKKRLKSLLRELLDLLQSVKRDGDALLASYAYYYPHGGFSKSAHNLAAYLTLRNHDLLSLQSRLARLGFSSLARGGGHVINNLERVTGLIADLLNNHVDLPHGAPAALGFDESSELLNHNANKILGRCEPPRRTRIMVTLAYDAAFDYRQVLELIEQGMNCARINCAHDDEVVWRRIVKYIRRAEKESGKSCRILMDIAGRKIRTGEVELGARVRHLSVGRDVYGHTTGPCVVTLMASTDDGTAEGLAGEQNRYTIPAKLHKKLAVEDRLEFLDSRGKPRHLDIIAKSDEGHWQAHCDQASYLLSGCTLNWMRADNDGSYSLQGEYNLGEFPGQPLNIRLFPDDPLLLSRSQLPGTPARYDRFGALKEPARIPCTAPSIIDDLSIGDPVWIDDGKIGLTVEAISDEGASLRVQHADPKGVRLQADKGINTPGTPCSLPPLSAKDLLDLDFISTHADMIGYSFIETVADMEVLLSELEKRKSAKLPVVAKIETGTAVNNLPDILLTTIGRHPFAIMIARGDLSVEVGSVMLAEYQEEILWLCEAAQVPVIWATQVLDTLAKKGRRSRPEFTDAAMGERAECVMLNKGPFIIDALHALDQVLLHMEAHQVKRFPLLPPLMWRTNNTSEAEE
jgi:pyruvate kinase